MIWLVSNIRDGDASKFCSFVGLVGDSFVLCVCRRCVILVSYEGFVLVRVAIWWLSKLVVICPVFLPVVTVGLFAVFMPVVVSTIAPIAFLAAFATGVVV